MYVLVCYVTVTEGGNARRMCNVCMREKKDVPGHSKTHTRKDFTYFYTHT